MNLNRFRNSFRNITIVALAAAVLFGFNTLVLSQVFAENIIKVVSSVSAPATPTPTPSPISGPVNPTPTATPTQTPKPISIPVTPTPTAKPTKAPVSKPINKPTAKPTVRPSIKPSPISAPIKPRYNQNNYFVNLIQYILGIFRK